MSTGQDEAVVDPQEIIDDIIEMMGATDVPKFETEADKLQFIKEQVGTLMVQYADAKAATGVAHEQAARLYDLLRSLKTLMAAHLKLLGAHTTARIVEDYEGVISEAPWGHWFGLASNRAERFYDWVSRFRVLMDGLGDLR